MKITMYELIGLVKDGKAPKKIKYKNNIYEYDGETQNYCSPINMVWDFLIGKDIVALLDDEVEIIEYPKKIEKIEIYEDEYGHYFLNKQDRKVYVNCDEMDFMVDKFNELIDEINNLKEND